MTRTMSRLPAPRPESGSEHQRAINAVYSAINPPVWIAVPIKINCNTSRYTVPVRVDESNCAGKDDEWTDGQPRPPVTPADFWLTASLRPHPPARLIPEDEFCA